MDEKIKTWPLHFPTKENPNMEKALFHWPVALQYDVKAKYWLISGKFFEHEVSSAEHSFNQPKATRVCIRSQIALFCLFVVSVLFVRLYFKVIQKSPYQDCNINLLAALCYLKLHEDITFLVNINLFKNILLNEHRIFKLSLWIFFKSYWTLETLRK